MNIRYLLSSVALTLLTTVSVLAASETITLSTGATLEIFQADAAKANGCAVIACPGGGYAYRADEKEGSNWASFMNERGYTLAVLKYRLPKGNHSGPLADGRAAMKYLRDNASTLKLDPTHVGVMGFSAGGHLASTIATHTEGAERPAFQILFYPVITMEAGKTHQGSIDELLGQNPSAALVQEYSNQLHVDANAPMAYITYSDDDGTVPPLTNGKVYYDALVANSVPVTLKTYTTGGHGWSPGDKLGATLKAEMQTHFSNWLANNLEPELGIAEIPEDLSEQVYSRATVGEWKDSDKADCNASSAVTVDAVNGLGASGNLSATYLSKSFAIGKNYKVTYEAEWTFASATGRDANWNWIQFGDFLRIGINSTYNMRVSTDGGITWNATTLGYYYNKTYTKHIKVVFNTATKSVESFWFDGTDRTALVAGTFNGKAFNSVSTGFTRGGSVSWTLANYLTTIVVTQEEVKSELATYTMNYKDGNDIVKTTSAIVAVGTEVPVDAYLWKDGVKYKRAAGEPDAVTVDTDGSVFDIAVAEAATYSYALKTSTGATLASGSGYEQESVTVAYKAFCLDGTTLYAVDKTSGGYRTTFTLDTDNKEVVLNATKKAENVCFYAEGEDIAGATATSAGNNMLIRSSNAQCGYATADVALVTLPAGTYTANTVLYSNNTAGLTLKFRYDTDYDDAVTGASNWMEKTYDFTLTAAADIRWLASGDERNGLDLIYITGTTTCYPVAIGPAGWATLFTPLALDFAAMEGVTAYTATLDGDIVTLTEVTNVPANTGVVLKGAAGSYAIPTLASSTTPQGSLRGNATAATAYDAISGNTLYVLAVNDDGSIQFQPVGSGTVAAGKAYLAVGSTQVKNLNVVFADITGITATTDGDAAAGDAAIYNLAGQRVGDTSGSALSRTPHVGKGIYVANGKKVVIK